MSIRPLIAACVLVAACGVSDSRQSSEAFAQRYFAAAQQGNLSAVLTMYDKEFFKVMPRDRWANMYRDIAGKLGKPRRFTLVSWQAHSVQDNRGAGQYATLIYKVTYEQGEGTETLGLFIPRSGAPALRGHYFSSARLLG